MFEGMGKTLASGPSPLSPAVFAILLALVDGEKHGYGIMQEVRDHAPMGPGTLYGSLDRLLAALLIEETGLTDDERRRYYRLTGAGREALDAEATRMQANLARARRKGIKPIGVRA